jgi:MFS family permease
MLADMAGSATRHIVAIGLGTAVAPLDSAVNIAFPAITQGLGLTIGDIQWVVISYVLTYASLMLVFGRLGDRLGHAAIFRIGLIWSAAALVLCSLAPSFTGLLLCRILQGVGTALVLSCGAALTTGLYAEDRRSRVLGVYVMMMAVGATLGPWLGGALVEAWGWPAVFWFRAPIALAALLLLRGLPTSPVRPAAGRFDIAGAALLTSALVALLLALNHLGEPIALPLGVAALGLFAGFVRQEARSAAPMLDLAVFRRPGFVRLNVANVLTNLAGFAVWLLVPYFLVRATGFGLAANGAVLAAASAGTIIASPIGGRLIGRISAELLALAGALLAGIGLLLIGSWDRDVSALALIGALTVQGIGLGLFQIAYTDIVTAAMPRRDRGVAGSLALMTRTLGTVGAATLVLLLFQSLEPAAGFVVAFQRTFQLAAALPFAMAALLALPRRRAGAAL